MEPKLIAVVALALTALHFILLFAIASALGKIERHLRHLPSGTPVRASDRDMGEHDPRRRRDE
ncbi:MAG: hypothetical protein KC619_06105 [Myxococcales bacterium]|nr:hypothetical protein [Myxococcales bacterium]